MLPCRLCRQAVSSSALLALTKSPQRGPLLRCLAATSGSHSPTTSTGGSVFKVKTSSLPGPQAQMLSDIVMELGALSSSIEEARGDTEQEVFSNGPAVELWDNCTVSALFQPGQDGVQLMRAAASIAGADATQLQTETVEEREWVEAIEDSFHAIQITPGMWIVPGKADITDPDAVNILLAPGAAFGTGEHPTTKLCLQWLDGQQLQGRSVLDYGTGTGILGIAALLKGATRVLGTDVDPVALTAALRNAEANGVGASFQVEEVGHAPAASSALQLHDLSIANILKGPLLELAPVLAAQTGPGGLLGLSGILTSQVPDVQAAYEPHFDSFDVVEHDKWALLTARRRSC